MANYRLVAASLNILEMAARNMGGYFNNLFMDYLREVRSYKDYNFSTDLVTRITKDASAAKKAVLES